MANIQSLISKLNPNSKVVFFTGAGISAESGISTFRDPDGYWSNYDPMKLASQQGFSEDPELVLSWYNARRERIRTASPNAGHHCITDFQKLFQDSVVITQNVDGLHAQAGNDPVFELHGNIFMNKCNQCEKAFEMDKNSQKTLQHCSCGGPIRPDVVWFGESLDLQVLHNAFDKVRTCDIFFTIGTSTQIYPANQLPFEAQAAGAFTIEVNPESTPFSSEANMSLQEPAGIALPKLYEDFYAQLS